MNFEWNEYLTLATEWANSPNGSRYPQALYRSIISRVYYAVYHRAEELARILGLQSTSSASDHYRVRTFFADRGRVARQLSLLLRDLYHLRIGANYVIDAHDIVTRDAQTAAKQALDAAYKALAMIEHLNANKRS